MSTSIRATISQRNRYYIPKHRYLELVHLCRQYDDWVKELSGICFVSNSLTNTTPKSYKESKTEHDAIYISKLGIKKNTIEECSKQAAGELSNYILLAVTKGLSYENLRMVYKIPCCRQLYYEYYRYFFWLLDQEIA